MATTEFRALETPAEKANSLRSKFGSPVKEIARALGCSPSSASRYLSGKRTGATKGRPSFLTKSDEKQLVATIIDAHEGHRSMTMGQVHQEVCRCIKFRRAHYARPSRLCRWSKNVSKRYTSILRLRLGPEHGFQGKKKLRPKKLKPGRRTVSTLPVEVLPRSGSTKLRRRLTQQGE